MTLALYAHPFSSYCWKVQIALWEMDLPFDYRSLEDPEHGPEWQRLSPTGKMPILVDGDNVVFETSIIIEHLQLNHPAKVQLIPRDPAAALEVRLLDRMSDAYVMGAMQAVVDDALRGAEGHCQPIVDGAKARLDRSYAWWNMHMDGRTWAAGDFSMADCAAAPAFFYADWAHPIPDELTALKAYRARLLAHPSVSRAVEEARPYRPYFPLGAPDRD
jgi:glutathione S-transferase